MRSICYVSGTRADFGLMEKVLTGLHHDPDVDLSIIVTGMHLSKTYGHTIDEIKAKGFHIAEEVPVDLEETTNESMSEGVGVMLIGITKALAKVKPDMVLLLGDRGETLAAAIAAAHLNIHVAHVHGGERSGTVDEMVRHAISKFTHFHFAVTEKGKERLIKMGEHPSQVYNFGAPGLDAIFDYSLTEKKTLFKEYGFDLERKTALLVYHPVTQEVDTLEHQMKEVLDACLEKDLQVLCLLPNSDAGTAIIRRVIDKKQSTNIVPVVHLPRVAFLSWMKAVDVMMGNSSAGIIEAASVNTPVINIGTRQNLREYGDNVTHVSPDKNAICNALSTLFSQAPKQYENVYGKGVAAKDIVKTLKSVSLEKELLNKCNAY